MAIAPPTVPYVALGDSLTHGMQSAGVCWLSQHASYPKLIADFIGATPFRQPVLKGWIPGLEPKGAGSKRNDRSGPRGQRARVWTGNPPNLELVLRRAEALLDERLGASTPRPQVWRELHDEFDAISDVLCEAITDYVRSVEDGSPEDFVFELPAPNGYFQNLGVFGFTVEDVSKTSYASLQRPLQPTFRGRVARMARHAVEEAADVWSAAFKAHPSLLGSLSAALLTVLEGDFGARLQAERVGYVLGRGSQTALEIARAQQPRIVTLLIGNNNALFTMTQARMWNDDGTPRYTPSDEFRTQTCSLVEEILQFDSQPHIFLATLPTPTASPNLERNRLGHWKSMLPSAAFLIDAQLLELEDVIQAYNQAIQSIADAHAGRVHIVDFHALVERLVRGTRHDAEVVRRGVAHAVRAGVIEPPQAHAAVQAAQAGNLGTIDYLRTVNVNLMNRPFTEVKKLKPEESGSNLAQPDLSEAPSDVNLDAFTVRLKSGKLYRLTGEFISSGDDHAIAQGGAVGLDSVHLTNTGYAYVARLFLRAIYDADKQSNGAILRGLSGQGRDPAEFDATVLQIAKEDTLLNGVPRLIPATMDALGALSDMVGEFHFPDPYLQG